MAREKFNKVVFLAPEGLSDPTCLSPDWNEIRPFELPSYLTHDKSVAEGYFPQGEDDARAFELLRVREEEIVGRLYESSAGGPSNVRHLLARITNPTLVVWGTHDRLMPFGQSNLWLDALPNAELLTVVNTGHLLLQENPSTIGDVAKFLAD